MHIVVSFAVIVLSLASWGCSGVVSPAAPSPLAGGSSDGASLLYEPELSGSSYQLTGFDGTTFSFANNQGSYALPYTTDIRFRRAILNTFPNDPITPCRVLAEQYNAVDGINSDGFLALLGGYASAGCNARIVVQFPTDPLLPPNPILPPSPIRILSFQPIP
jgi:hypothetical protein